MTPTIVELLSECVDALKVPALDPEHRDRHVVYLTEATAAAVDAPLHELLDQTARAIVALRDRLPHDPTPSWITKLVSKLEEELKKRSAPRFLYHGTIAGRLSAIAEQGLVPGAVRVWTHRDDLRRRSDAAVYFTDTWRGAVFWATAAHEHARGPRAGRFRRPVVIRIPATGKVVVPDDLAAPPGCWAIRGTVSVEKAGVMHGPLEGFPKWRQLRLLGEERIGDRCR
jgi:hypothetical protein